MISRGESASLASGSYKRNNERQEKIINRVHKVAKNELNSNIISEKTPIEINEIMLNQKNRGHFISILFSCKLIDKLPEKLKYVDGVPKICQWKCHNKCPHNIIFTDKIYK